MDDDDSVSVLRRFRNGDFSAFQAVYDHYAPTLYRVAWRLLRDAHLAEDALQEVFLSLLKAGSRLADVRDLRTYLFACVRRAAQRLKAGQSRWKTFNEVAGPEKEPCFSPSDASTPSLSDRFLRAVQRLPWEQQEVLALKIDGHLTFAEIGLILGISANTAASRYRYALGKLREYIQGEGD